MTFPLIKRAALCAVLFLAACDDAEERAERYYQSGLALLAAGDTDRALIEFRNVFQHDGFHKDARQIYADTLRDLGRNDDAYGQYLRLIEQYPDTADVRLTLAEIALGRNDWDEVRRHGNAGVALTPDAPRAQAVAAAIAYTTALRADDADALQAATTRAKTVLDTTPDNLVALRVVIDAAARGPLPETALPLLEQAISLDPTSLEFHGAKLRLLTDMKDDPAAIAQLETMFDRFPENQEVRTALVNWHLEQQNYPAAETILRDMAGDPVTAPQGHMTVVQFLRRAYGDQAALDELNALATATADQDVQALYQATAALLMFEADPAGPGLATMQAMTETLPDSDQSRRIKAMYAQMLIATDDETAARAVVADILAEDTTNVEALKMRAAWAIDADSPDAAITDLRSALSQSPRDPDIMMLMATAHERTGFPELAGERLALAVEVSNAATVPSLRYARFLMRDGRTQAAAAVLIDARRSAPTDLELISVLADLHLGEQDWPRATALLGELRAMAERNPRAGQLATALEAAILSAQNRTDESLAVLQDQLEDMDEDGRAALTIALAQIRAGKLEEARTYLDTAVTDRPDDMTLRMLSGSVAMMDGDADEAESVFRAVLNDAPETEAAVRLLYSLLHLQGRDTEKAQVLETGLATLPDSETLLWIKAGALEQTGDIDGAIGIYEDLYTRDSSNVVVANNLASLLAAHRDDTASLDRAYRIARRLRGVDVPAFQDTYGWIVYRRGDHAEALDYLRPAALGLPGDPLVQYHLGKALHALGRTEEATQALTQALDLAGDSPLPQFTDARTLLSELLQ
ncbi:tetratricopeptide repeat protein [Loktanella sp. F6476L]|uniref:tetratricopeptide repeat protein n=1 Tax=Loktanella sp. F6476L TaxID=2926405 RepID=UPI001FF31FFF|nr:tetratricopeptide repeat protein [Loktanella sp. F6476L]MCK0122102.1 tetratricopeptide repeat protein [Loktanella sp. F6476L]